MDLGRLLVAGITAISAAYQLAAVVACVVYRRSAQSRSGELPSISVLKPLKGADASLRDAIRSHLALPGSFELLCGYRADDSMAAAVVQEFPRVRAVVCSTATTNAKVGSLVDLVAAAKYDLLIQNDADICVPPDYFEKVAGPLVQDSGIAFVTCLDRKSTRLNSSH